MLQQPECTVILASASPRRRRLISWLGLPVELTAVDTPEDLDSPLAAQPGLLAATLAAEKARAAGEERKSGSPQTGAQVIVAFDTIVVLDGQVLGKPADTADAWRMLRALSGRIHQVVTGVAIIAPAADEPSEFSVTTRVRMRDLSNADIESWMARGEFLGCAGAYNIEGQVADVDVDECYQNVAGLPLCHLRAALASMAPACRLARLASPVAPCDRALGRRCELGPRLG